MIDLTPIFQAIIALLAAIITYKLIPWIKSKTTEQQRENLSAAARIVVYAAEQIYGAGNGETKLKYALEALRRAGFDIDTDLAREAIERVVREMNFRVEFFDELEATVEETEEPEEPDTGEPEEHPPEQQTILPPPEQPEGSWDVHN
jgi:hypothetical protein